MCGLDSGGVDSTVTAVLVHKAIGDRLQCVFVDTGLMRMNEVEDIKRIFTQNFNIQLDVVDATKVFLANLKVLKIQKKKKNYR